MNRTPQGNAKIKYWGGTERDKENPMVLVYDDGTTSPNGRPVWRKKMRAIDVVSMHEKGMMEPINCHEMCKRSKCATLEQLEELAKNQAPSRRVNIGSRADGSENVTVQITNTFPWREDGDGFQFRNKPKNIEMKWNEDGSLQSASAILMRNGEELVVTIANRRLSVVGPDDEQLVIQSANSDQLWAEWWFFRCERISYTAFVNMIKNCTINPISGLSYPSHVASDSVRKKVGERHSCEDFAVSTAEDEYEKRTYDSISEHEMAVM